MSKPRIAAAVVVAMIYLGGWFGAAVDINAAFPASEPGFSRVGESILVGAAWPALYTASVVGNQLMPKGRP